jgi:hypothetical protein
VRDAKLPPARLLHYAVESEAKLETGFWGNLAKGKTLAEMNDRTGRAMEAEGPEMAAIEQLVGALHGSTKGRSPAEMVEGIRRFAEGLGSTVPGWLTDAFVAAVQERMRQLVGRWKATPFGASMDLTWRG